LIDGVLAQTAENIRDALCFINAADAAFIAADFGEMTSSPLKGRALLNSLLYDG